MLLFNSLPGLGLKFRSRSKLDIPKISWRTGAVRSNDALYRLSCKVDYAPIKLNHSSNRLEMMVSNFILSAQVARRFLHAGRIHLFAKQIFSVIRQRAREIYLKCTEGLKIM